MNEKSNPPTLSIAVPKELGIPPDTLRLRLDFFHQSTVMTAFKDDTVVTKLVDAMAVAHSLATELTFSTGLLPPGTIWWQNTRAGAFYAIYVEPKVWPLALQENINKPPRRFKVPLPGFIFLCVPGQTPWVFAVKKKPTKETDMVYKAPLANIFNNGRSCPGSHKYPTRVADIVQSFFISYFSSTADLGDRSKQYPRNIIDLWKKLDGKKQFPLNDLMEHGQVRDIMNMEMR